MHLFEMQNLFVKNLIRDTIETYSGQWRLVHEAVQNAHDAIQLDPDSASGTIEVDLHVGQNYVRVRDTGKGIPEAEAATLFSLGGTAKSPDDLRKLVKGSQGVGIKATIYTSKYFQVETETCESRWSLRLERCHLFMGDDFDADVGEPHQVPRSDSRFTEVRYALADYSVQDFIEEVVADYLAEFAEDGDEAMLTDVGQLKHVLELYLRTQTYIGCVQRLLESNDELKPINVKVRVFMDDATLEKHKGRIVAGCPFLSDERRYGDALTFEFPATYFDFKQWHSSLGGNKADRVFESMAEAIESPPPEELTKILIQKITPGQAEWLLYDVRKNRDTGRNEFVRNDARIAKHQNLLAKLNGIYLIIGPRDFERRFLNLSAKHVVSVNGSPTNVLLNAPRRGGELGYLLNTHIVVDLDTTMGYGKRNIPPVVKGQVDAYFADIFPMIRKAAKNLVGRGAPEQAPDESLWPKELLFEEYKSASNFMRTVPLCYGMTPTEEQDLICIFHQLIGAGHLEGYKPLRTSGVRVYDSAMFIDNKTDDARSWTDIKNVEFKLRLTDLVSDFIEQHKFIEELDLVVVWEIDYTGDEFFVSDMGRDGIRSFPGVKKRIRSGNRWCQILELKPLVEALRDGTD